MGQVPFFPTLWNHKGLELPAGGQADVDSVGPSGGHHRLAEPVSSEPWFQCPPPIPQPGDLHLLCGALAFLWAPDIDMEQWVGPTGGSWLDAVSVY